MNSLWCYNGGYLMLYIFQKPTEYATSRVNPNVNYGLQIIIMCQGRLITFNKWTTLMQDAGSRGRRKNVGSVLSAQFCYEYKIALIK